MARLVDQMATTGSCSHPMVSAGSSNLIVSTGDSFNVTGDSSSRPNGESGCRFQVDKLQDPRGS